MTCPVGEQIATNWIDEIKWHGSGTEGSGHRLGVYLLPVTLPAVWWWLSYAGSKRSAIMQVPESYPWPISALWPSKTPMINQAGANTLSKDTVVLHEFNFFGFGFARNLTTSLGPLVSGALREADPRCLRQCREIPRCFIARKIWRCRKSGGCVMRWCGDKELLWRPGQ